MGIVSEAGVEAAPTPSATVDIVDLSVTSMDPSPFDGLIPKPMESVGEPSLFFPEHGPIHHIRA